MARRTTRPTQQSTLLEHAAGRGTLSGPPAPLADRMRPRTLDEIVGQQHLLARGKPLREAIESDRMPSLILWGPPGSGKSMLAARLPGQEASLQPQVPLPQEHAAEPG